MKRYLLDKRLWGGLLLAGLAAMSWWLVRSTMEGREPGAESQAHVADYYLTGFKATRFDQQGAMRQRLEANSTVHYADDDTTEMQSPRLVVYGSDGNVWQLSAEQGWAGADQKVVWLRGEVNLHRQRADEGGEVTMVTRDVKVLPDEEYAETDQYVLIGHEQGVMEAVGMQISLRENQMHLLSKVRGNYVPK